MHVGALAGFFTFSWQALGVCLFLWWLTRGVGIRLDYHRYFTHRSYAALKWVADPGVLKFQPSSRQPLRRSLQLCAKIQRGYCRLFCLWDCS